MVVEFCSEIVDSLFDDLSVVSAILDDPSESVVKSRSIEPVDDIPFVVVIADLLLEKLKSDGVDGNEVDITWVVEGKSVDTPSVILVDMDNTSSSDVGNTAVVEGNTFVTSLVAGDGVDDIVSVVGDVMVDVSTVVEDNTVVPSSVIVGEVVETLYVSVCDSVDALSVVAVENNDCPSAVCESDTVLVAINNAELDSCFLYVNTDDSVVDSVVSDVERKVVLVIFSNNRDVLSLDEPSAVDTRVVGVVMIGTKMVLSVGAVDLDNSITGVVDVKNDIFVLSAFFNRPETDFSKSSKTSEDFFSLMLSIRFWISSEFKSEIGKRRL